MFKFRSLHIEGGTGRMPKTRQETKRQLRHLAKTMGLDLQFVTRRKSGVSWCDITEPRAVVCEGTRRGLFNRIWVIHASLHEMSHWVQYNEGLFANFYAKPRYGRWEWPSEENKLRVALRAERHCDWLARKMSQKLFGFRLQQGCSVYDDPVKAREHLLEHYTRAYRKMEGRENELPTYPSPTQEVYCSRIRRS